MPRMGWNIGPGCYIKSEYYKARVLYRKARILYRVQDVIIYKGWDVILGQDII